MAEISSKAAMAAVTPKATADKSQGSGDGVGGLGGFSSLPSSIHHGLSEKLQGLTEKLHQLGQKMPTRIPLPEVEPVVVGQTTILA